MLKRISGIWLVLLLVSSEGLAQSLDWIASPAARRKAAAEYYQQGNETVQQDRFSLAIAYYDSAIHLNPRSVQYFFARAQAKEWDEDFIGALADYEAVVRMDMDNYTGLFKRALIYYQKKNYQQAIDDFTFLIDRMDTSETQAVFFKGVSYHEKGETAFSSVSTVEGMKAEIYLARAQAYEKIEADTQAMDDYDQAIALQRLDPDYYVKRGLFMADQGNTEAAILDFRRALAIDSLHRLALYNLTFYVEGKEKDKMNKTLYALGDFGLAYSKKGYENIQQGRYEEAIADYDSALAITGKNADVLMNRGIAKARVGRYEEAIVDFDTSLRADRTLVRNLVLIANAYQSLRRYDEAISHYCDYLRYDAEDGAVYYNLGLAYIHAEEKDKACNFLRRAHRLGEKHAEPVIKKHCAIAKK